VSHDGLITPTVAPIVHRSPIRGLNPESRVVESGLVPYKTEPPKSTAKGDAPCWPVIDRSASSQLWTPGANRSAAHRS